MALQISRRFTVSRGVSEIVKLSAPDIATQLKYFVQSRRYLGGEKRLVLSAVVKELNKPLTVETTKQSTTLKSGQVRIGVHCCAVNVSDYLLWTGQSAVQASVPFVPGFEISGEVLEVSPKTSSKDGSGSEDEDELKPGDRVLALNKENLNGFASECIVDHKDVFVIPSSVPYTTAAALADSYGTAMLGVARRARVQQNEVVLITAAGGGLGLAAVDIAANLYKAKVIGICGTEEKCTLVRERGAWAAFTYRNDKKLKDEVARISEGRGASLIFEAVGGEVFRSALECVAPEGKVIIAGFTSRDVPQLSMNDILQLPSFSLIGVSLLNYRNKMFSVYRRTIFDVIELYENGLISPAVSKVFPLEQVNEAFSYLSQQKATGKIILEVPQK